jgi:hypothetical protein
VYIKPELQHGLPCQILFLNLPFRYSSTSKQITLFSHTHTNHKVHQTRNAMRFTLPILALAATVLALPAPPAPAGSCTFSANEKLNLLHGHDVNTGKIKLGNTITPTLIIIGGSGCSPAWAVGGKITDDTPTPTKTKLTG